MQTFFKKKHIIDEGMTLVMQAEDTASNKKAEKKDVVIGLDQAFVRNVFELHDKYLQYVSNALYIIPSFTRL